MQLALASPDPTPVVTGASVSVRHIERAGRYVLVLAAALTLAACAGSGGKGGPVRNIAVVTDPAPIVSGTMRPYTIRGRTYRPAEQPNYDETGMASWYGQYHHGRSTSSGERFDMNALTAAHKTLPLPSMVEVTNTANGRRVLLRVNDRGPFVDNRIIDLSRGAAEALGLLERGVGEVRVRYAGRAPRTGGGVVLTEGGGRAEPARRSGSRSTTERPYNEVVREQTTSRRPTAQSRTTNTVPIPQQPLPPVMPPRDAPLVLTPQSPSPQTPPPQTPPPVANPVPTYVRPVAPRPRYRVQVIAFDERAFADGIARRLGGDTVVESFERNGRTLYRVVAGSFSDQAVAEQARQAIIARGFAEALLIAD
ncbi:MULTISPECIES: septal ring lytic transglycosylase RlpA family protein [unclassified Brevundimonas]|uniref:septal ring lytic transglycosylase RlpA family protein n=1 Tax=unclassified Brevundimonas TaxID=2622653 RepID=UPI0025B9320A|nr:MULTISPECIES: septal ring lytic transglycosylase RlpA family protein [unclassified Brevundimonas]